MTRYQFVWMATLWFLLTSSAWILEDTIIWNSNWDSTDDVNKKISSTIYDNFIQSYTMYYSSVITVMLYEFWLLKDMWIDDKKYWYFSSNIWNSFAWAFYRNLSNT